MNNLEVSKMNNTIEVSGQQMIFSNHIDDELSELILGIMSADAKPIMNCFDNSIGQYEYCGHLAVDKSNYENEIEDQESTVKLLIDVSNKKWHEFNEIKNIPDLINLENDFFDGEECKISFDYEGLHIYNGNVYACFDLYWEIA